MYLRWTSNEFLKVVDDYIQIGQNQSLQGPKKTFIHNGIPLSEIIK